MGEGSKKAREIVLRDKFGNIAIRANGVRVEIHTDGSVVAYTKSDVDAYTNGAVHVHSAVNDECEPAAKGEPKPGDRMADGTVYAGISPDTGKAIYTMPTDAPLPMKWNTAMAYAARLDARGHEDWRVPTQGEINVLYNNRAAIDGFDLSGSDPAGWYWSSSQSFSNHAWAQRFNDGHQTNYTKNNASSLRCVRG